MVVRAQDPNAARHRIVSSIGPIVVPPAARKAYTSPWISKQWHLALNRVRNADEIVVIGYSLPETDIRPRLLIQLARFRRKEVIPITLVAPCDKKLRKRYEHTVGRSLKIIDQKWEAVTSDL